MIMAKDNVYGFYKNLKLDEEGNVLCKMVNSSGLFTKPGSRYQFYKDITIDEEGYLLITE